MPDITIGAYRPSGPVPAVAGQAASGTAQAQSAAEAELGADVAEVTGGTSQTRGVSVEQALARLMEQGLVDSASRPLAGANLPAQAEAGAVLTVTLADGEAEIPEEALAAEAGELPENAKNLLLEDSGFLQVYGPDAQLARLAGNATLLDGKLLTMLLFGQGGGLDLLLNMGGTDFPPGQDGSVLAGFLDGSFRLLNLDKDVLNRMLDSGQARLTPQAPEQSAQPQAKADALPQAEGGGKAAPNPSEGGAAPVRQDAGQAVPKTEAGPARPPVPEGTPPRRQDAAIPEPRLNVPASPSGKPGGTVEWATMKAAEQSFRQVTENWLRDTEDPFAPEAREQLAEMRQDWAEGLRKEDPAVFRAWLEISRPQLSAAAETGDNVRGGQEQDTALPKDFTARDYSRWMSRDILSYEAKQGHGAGLNWLREFVRGFVPDRETESASQVKYAYYAQAAARKADDEDIGSMVRRFSDYLAQIMSGRSRHSTREQAESLETPPEPKRQNEELEKAWKRRKIAWEVDSDWTGNLKQWLLHVDGWRVEKSQDYVNGQVNAWSTAMMQDQPARFRQWLSSPLRYAADSGWFNGATASFPIRTLPEGFTDADLRQWLQWDVLDFL